MRTISSTVVLKRRLGTTARTTGLGGRIMAVGRACISLLHEDEHGLRAPQAGSHVTEGAPASAAARRPDQGSQRAGGRQTLAGAPRGGVGVSVMSETLMG